MTVETGASQSKRRSRAKKPREAERVGTSAPIGFLEVVRPFQVRGWAHDPECPDERLAVDVFVDGELVSSGVADLFRDDLLRAGYGDGHHGFVVNFDTRLPTDSSAEVEVRARSRFGDPVPLPTIASWRLMDAEAAAPVEEAPASPIEGYYAVVGPSEVRGWAFDRTHPDERLKIEVLRGEEVLGAALADRPRADLAQALGGSGDYSFEFRSEDGEMTPGGSVRVRALSTSGQGMLLELPASPDAASPGDAPSQGSRLTFPGLAVDPDQHPVFILGAARSGTSAIAQALIGATRYEGYEEGHLLDVAGQLFDTVSRHFALWRHLDNTLVAAVPESFVKEGVQHLLVEIARTQHPKGWWLDKTPRPAMIACAPILRQIWPQSRFIFMKRRAIENLASRTRKFAGRSFEQHCTDWAVSMQFWAEVRDALAGAAIEIDQLTLARDSAAVAQALQPFLSLESKEVTKLIRALDTDRPERTAQQFAATYSIEELGWSAKDRQVFETICGASMEQYGYAMGPEYYCADREFQSLVLM